MISRVSYSVPNLNSPYHTVWKCHNLGKHLFPKNAILTILEDMTYDFDEFLQFQNAEIFQNQDRVSYSVKVAVFEAQFLPKLISRKI